MHSKLFMIRDTTLHVHDVFFVIVQHTPEDL